MWVIIVDNITKDKNNIKQAHNYRKNAIIQAFTVYIFPSSSKTELAVNSTDNSSPESPLSVSVLSIVLSTGGKTVILVSVIVM